VNPEVARHLRCPLCQCPFQASATTMRCDSGHHFDVARQGYVNLLVGRAPAGADTAEMVTARAELLAEGHFDFLTRALVKELVEESAEESAEELVEAPLQAPVDTASTAVPTEPGLVVDVGAGTGHYLAAILDSRPDHHGLALDVAKAAARRAARAHPRAGAAVCDIWRGLPIADHCADVVLDVFAPRNAAEFRRVLRPDGVLLVVTPRPEHLAELVRSLGLIGVDPDKDRRLDATFGDLFRLDRETALEKRLSLSHDMAARFVAMGPSAWHTDPEHLSARLADLPEPVTTTSSVSVRVYRPLSS
jgi:23S rRNA (guanine745-N1)-methyltransferase